MFFALKYQFYGTIQSAKMTFVGQKCKRFFFLQNFEDKFFEKRVLESLYRLKTKYLLVPYYIKCLCAIFEAPQQFNMLDKSVFFRYFDFQTLPVRIIMRITQPKNAHLSGKAGNRIKTLCFEVEITKNWF